MMQKVQTKVKSRSKTVIIPHLPTNLQPHVNWYSPHKRCFFNQSYCVLYRNFIIVNDKQQVAQVDISRFLRRKQGQKMH